MTDWAELKRLAGAALRNWPDSKLFDRPECDRFIDAASPDVVLGLIERATAGRQHHLDSEELRSLCQHRDQLKAENEALRSALEKISAYAPCSGIKDPGFTKMHMGILARDAIDAAISKGEQV